MKTKTNKFDELEQRLELSPPKAAQFLGVSYNGGYAMWKSGTRKTPAYVVFSIEAYLLLPRTVLRVLIDKRVK